MSATSDVKHTLDNLHPGKDETILEFAKRGLLWQNEVYSANAGSDLGMTWDTISEDDRSAWLRWAVQKIKAGRAK